MAFSSPTRDQVAHVIAISVSAYCLYSAYSVFGTTNSWMKTGTSVLVASMEYLLAMMVVLNVRRNVCSLRQRAEWIVIQGAAQVRHCLLQKADMLLSFGVAAGFYYIYSSVFMMVLMFVGIADRTAETWNGINAVLDWAVVTATATIFHPCFFTEAFRLGQVAVDPDGEAEQVTEGQFAEVVIDIRRLEEGVGREMMMVVQPADLRGATCARMRGSMIWM